MSACPQRTPAAQRERPLMDIRIRDGPVVACRTSDSLAEPIELCRPLPRDSSAGKMPQARCRLLLAPRLARPLHHLKRHSAGAHKPALLKISSSAWCNRYWLNPPTPALGLHTIGVHVVIAIDEAAAILNRTLRYIVHVAQAASVHCLSMTFEIGLMPSFERSAARNRCSVAYVLRPRPESRPSQSKPRRASRTRDVPAQTSGR